MRVFQRAYSVVYVLGIFGAAVCLAPADARAGKSNNKIQQLKAQQKAQMEAMQAQLKAQQALQAKQLLQLQKQVQKMVATREVQKQQAQQATPATKKEQMKMVAEKVRQMQQGASTKIQAAMTELPGAKTVTATVVTAASAAAQSAAKVQIPVPENKVDLPVGMMRVGIPLKKPDVSDDKPSATPTLTPKAPVGRNVPLGALAPALGTFAPRVILAPGLTADVRRTLAAAYDISPAQAGEMTRIRLQEHQEAAKVLGTLRDQFPQQAFGLNHRYMAYPSADGTLGISRDADHCEASRCYGRPLIHWQEAHTTCARGVKVGIIDTGIDAKHRSLARLNTAAMRDPADTSPPAPNWHGTGVTALLAGARGTGTPGLIPDAQFAIRDAFFTNGEGQAETDTERLIWALRSLDSWGAQIINMSLVGPPDPLVHSEIVKLSRKGVVLVAAAGNGGISGEAAYPAAYRNEVIAVTAVDRERRNYANATQGDYIDVAAPGVRIWTALPNNKEGPLSGTSFAAPFVTAIAAAAYNNTPLPAMRSGTGPAVNPKLVVLERMAIDRVAGGVRDPIFGLGFAKAPAACGSQGAPPAIVQPQQPSAPKTAAVSAQTDVATAPPPIAPLDQAWRASTLADPGAETQRQGWQAVTQMLPGAATTPAAQKR